MRRHFCVAAGLVLAASSAHANLMIPDSGSGDRIMLFDRKDGALIDANWLTDVGAVGWFFTTPKEAIVVETEIWVSDQVADAIHRFKLSDRGFIGSITTGSNGANLDNLRGMGHRNGEVAAFVWPSATANRGVYTFKPDASAQGFVPLNLSGFDVEFIGDDWLISNSTSNNVERRRTDGTLVSNFLVGKDFPQQVAQMSDGSYLMVSSIAPAGEEGIWHLNSDGSLRKYISTEPIEEMVPRGAFLLDDGNYLLATSQGVYTVSEPSPGTFAFNLVLGGVDGQYINLVPEPGAAAALLLGGMTALRRRR